MKASELKEKIKLLVKQVYQDKSKIDDAAIAYDELTKFPLLKDVIVDLLTSDFDSFLEDIEWVSPRPTVFRIATVEGKKYYLLNLDEEENCALAIGRILQYGPKSGAEVEGEEAPAEEAPEVEDEVDVNVDVEA